MPTELELRQSVVNVMKGWLGYSEANGKFKQIIDLYNTQKPLPVGYKVQYDDEWCATTVTAAGMAAGLHDIILGECSCSRMIELYKKAGRWMEDDSYRPQIGDIVMYYWKDGSNYATTDCTANPNHVGIVGAVNGNDITVYEGNKGEAVATRTIKVNGRYIRGYCLPDYASKATKDTQEDDDMTEDRVKEIVSEAVKTAQPRVYTTVAECPAWARNTVQSAIDADVLNGDGTGKLHLTDDNLLTLQMLYNLKLFK